MLARMAIDPRYLGKALQLGRGFWSGLAAKGAQNIIDGPRIAGLIPQAAQQKCLTFLDRENFVECLPVDVAKRVIVGLRHGANRETAAFWGFRNVKHRLVFPHRLFDGQRSLYTFNAFESIDDNAVHKNISVGQPFIEGISDQLSLLGWQL